MKKILLMLFVLLSINFAYYCYQETATVATDCGGLATGSYSHTGFDQPGDNYVDIIDGDWSSYGTSLLQTSDLYMDYTIPNNIVGAIWQVRDLTGVLGDITTANITITPECLSGETLQLRLEILSGDQGKWYCNDGTWQLLRTANPNPTYNAYEEGIYWETDPQLVDICGELSESDKTYELVNDLTASAGQTCLLVTGSNITIDGKGYTVSGGDATGAIGGNAIELDNAIGVTVKDVILQGGDSTGNFAAGVGLYADVISGEELNLTNIIAYGGNSEYIGGKGIKTFGMFNGYVFNVTGYGGNVSTLTSSGTITAGLGVDIDCEETDYPYNFISNITGYGGNDLLYNDNGEGGVAIVSCYNSTISNVKGYSGYGKSTRHAVTLDIENTILTNITGIGSDVTIGSYFSGAGINIFYPLNITATNLIGIGSNCTNSVSTCYGGRGIFVDEYYGDNITFTDVQAIGGDGLGTTSKGNTGLFIQSTLWESTYNLLFSNLTLKSGNTNTGTSTYGYGLRTASAGNITIEKIQSITGADNPTNNAEVYIEGLCDVKINQSSLNDYYIYMTGYGDVETNTNLTYISSDDYSYRIETFGGFVFNPSTSYTIPQEYINGSMFMSVSTSGDLKYYYDPDKFSVGVQNTLDYYTYSGGVWTAQSATLDTVEHSLEITLLSGEYGLLGANPTTLTITSPVNDTTYDNTVLVPLEFTTNGVECWYFLDSGPRVDIIDCLDTDIPLTEDGEHTIQVYSNDSDGYVKTESITFFIDIDPISITINEPADDAEFDTNTVGFEISATNPLDSSSTCIVFVDNSPLGASVTVDNGIPEIFDRTIPDGIHDIKIACNNSIDMEYFSATNTIIVSTTGPTTTYREPASGYETTNVPVNFKFRASSLAYTSFSCSIYVNNVLRDTNIATANNTLTTFTLSGFTPSTTPYSWFISCTDVLGNNANSSVWTLSNPNTGGGGGGETLPPTDEIPDENDTTDGQNEVILPPENLGGGVQDAINDVIPDSVDTIPTVITCKDTISCILSQWESLMSLFFTVPLLDRLNFGYFFLIFFALLGIYTWKRVIKRPRKEEITKRLVGLTVFGVADVFFLLTFVVLLLNQNILTWAIRGLGAST